ncbi:MAG: ABC transporter permease, partial [Oscillospiraceae bacterium]|nr:ABC transporter permease [Oscillospiraceae bacterium]
MKSKRLLHNISGVALPVLFGVLLVVLWQTQVLHALIGTDTITLPLPTRIGEIIAQNSETIWGHVQITLVVTLGGLIMGSILGYLIAIIATMFSKWGVGGLTIVSAFNAI